MYVKNYKIQYSSKPTYITLLCYYIGNTYRLREIKSNTTFSFYFQNAHPCRIIKIHVVHTVSFINQVMCLVKPLLHSHVLNLLNFSSEGPASVVDRELLPEDYGGPLPPVKEFHAEQRKNMEDNYRDWLIESEIFKVDEKKRIKKPSRGMFASFTSSFKGVEID